MANENIGDISCPFCGVKAHVRRYNPRRPPHGEGAQRGKFYIHCGECGPILASSKRVQEYILERGRLYGADKPQDSPPAATAKATGTSSPAAVRAPRTGITFFDPFED